MKKDYFKLCRWFFTASPSRCMLNRTYGCCKFGYKGFKSICKKCVNCIEEYKFNII